MRISYSDEEDHPGQFELWQANVTRSLKGKNGQRALRELESALLEGLARGATGALSKSGKRRWQKCSCLTRSLETDDQCTSYSGRPT